MKGLHIGLALFLADLTSGDIVCNSLKRFWGNKVVMFPTALIRVKQPDGLLNCIQNCTRLNSCRGYRYETTKTKCTLLDGDDSAILSKEDLPMTRPATSITRTRTKPTTTKLTSTALTTTTRPITITPTTTRLTTTPVTTKLTTTTLTTTAPTTSGRMTTPPTTSTTTTTLRSTRSTSRSITTRHSKLANGTMKKCRLTGYQFLKVSMTCVRLYKERLTWEKAKDFCSFEQGSLVIIKTEEKQRALENQVKATKDIREVWIGAYDKDRNDKFVWLDGSPLNFTAWGTGEPSHKFFWRYEENCVQFLYWKKFKWNDARCEEKVNFICETPSL